MLLASVGTVAGTVGWTARDRAARRAKAQDGVEAALKDGNEHADRALTLPEDPSRWEAALGLASSALERARTLSAGEPGLVGAERGQRFLDEHGQAALVRSHEARGRTVEAQRSRRARAALKNEVHERIAPQTVRDEQRGSQTAQQHVEPPAAARQIFE